MLYRGYEIIYGRVGNNGTDGYIVRKNGEFIAGAGTFKRGRLSKKYWEFWKSQAEASVDDLLRKIEDSKGGEK